MSREFIAKVRRGLKKPPHVIYKRFKLEANCQLERMFSSHMPRYLTCQRLLDKLEFSNLSELWHDLSQRPYSTDISYKKIEDFNAQYLGESEKIFDKAKKAMLHQVDLLGSGPIDLGSDIDWLCDYKTNISWPKKYMKDIQYNNLERSSDVKFPWELSRMQWMIPLGQAYLLTQDEIYAEKVKELLMDWIEKNEYAHSVNWACTMEVALRIVSWTWFFHVFKDAQSWQDETFQFLLIKSLYLHAMFTEKHLEYSDINGNHYTADAVGLVFAGLFFGKCLDAQRWHHLGWNILSDEILKQVYEDGVDYEASVAYHRLVLELFFYAAVYREKLGFETQQFYKKRIIQMAKFVECYTQPDGLVPLWGDADDARTLPFGSQHINDHRYLASWVKNHWNINELNHYDCSELFWLMGGFNKTKTNNKFVKKVKSAAFPDGGFYIMRNQSDHIFIDCGPIGLAGKGGHGHNDCLSFEAVLNGEKLITDCGAYLYTASYKDRNLFRSTSYHNTPQVDQEEMNRFIQWDYLWNLNYDAIPNVLLWEMGENADRFIGSHAGYKRLAKPVDIQREISLKHQSHELRIKDILRSSANHHFTIPLHFSTDVIVELNSENNQCYLQKNNKKYLLTWDSEFNWKVDIKESRVSETYGIVSYSNQLVWSLFDHTHADLEVCILPMA